MSGQPRTRAEVSRVSFLSAAFIGLFVVAPFVRAAEMTETVLANGLRVVLRPVDANPVICTAVLVRAGVAWEPEGMSGASHFLEHLLFNGTESRTQEELYADVDRIGAYNNATTRSDHTLFLLLAPGEHLDRALQIQSDMLLHSTLPPDKFDKEKGIVLAEMGRDANNPSHLADTFFTRRLHAGSPYARPVLGTVDSIRGLERDAVWNYYRERYVPNRMVLFLAGDFEPDDALERITRYFGGDGAPIEATPPDETLPAVPDPFDATTNLVHHNVQAGRAYLRAAFPAPGEGDPDATAFGLMTEIVGGAASPLEQLLKGGENPAVFDYSLRYETTGGTGILGFSASLTGEKTAEEVLGMTAETIVRTVRERTIDPVELRVLHQERLTEEATLEEQVHYYAMFRAPRLLQFRVADLTAEASRRDAVDIDTFSRLVDRYLDPPRAVVTVSGPDERTGVETTVEWPAIREAAATGANPSHAAGAPPEVVVLDNGLTLSVRTNPDDKVFAVHLIARNRSALEPGNRAGLADLVHRLLLRGSLARGASALDEELRGIGANVKFHDDSRFPFDDYRTTQGYSFAIIETRTENAFAALRLFAEILQTPRFDPVEIDRTVREMRDLARRNEESSRDLASRRFAELIAPKHPMSRPVAGTRDSLAGVNRAEIEKMYRRLFAPNNLILSIRGGGQAEVVMRRAREIFGGAGAAGGFALIDRRGIQLPTKSTPPPPVTRQAARHDEALGKRQSYLRMGAIVEVPGRDRAALAVASLVLSDRLQMDLRETQGLAYSIGASLGTLGMDRGLLSVAMGTAPDNVAKAEAEIHRVASELRAGPIERDEIRRVVAARAGRILMRRLPSQNQAMYDGLSLLHRRPTGGNLEFLEALSTVTPEQVAEAAKRYVDPDRWVVAIVR